MRGEDGRDERVIEEGLQLVLRDAGGAGIVERAADRAEAWLRAGDRMRTGAAAVMGVLGDVGEMREVGERPHDERCLARRERAEDVVQGLRVLRALVAMEAHRGLPDALDDLEDLVAFPLADRVAENGTEKADVVAQRAILLGELLKLGEFGGLRRRGQGRLRR